MFQRVSVHDHCGGDRGTGQTRRHGTGMALEQKLRPYILTHRHEEKRELSGNSVGFETSKSTS